MLVMLLSKGRREEGDYTLPLGVGQEGEEENNTGPVKELRRRRGTNPLQCRPVWKRERRWALLGGKCTESLRQWSSTTNKTQEVQSFTVSEEQAPAVPNPPIIHTIKCSCGNSTLRCRNLKTE